MHGDLLAESGQSVTLSAGFQRDDDTDLAEAGHHLVVTIGGDDTLRDGELGDSAQRHVLADRGNQLCQRFVDTVTGAGKLHRLEALDVAVAAQSQLGHLADESLEAVVAGNEVGLGIDLDHRALAAVGGDADQALGGHAAGLLGGGRQALLTQPVDGLFEVAGGLGERLLTIHHAGAGLFRADP